MYENMTEQVEENEIGEKQEAEKEIRWADKLYMLYENEMWLNEQAKKGLFLKHFDNGYAYFTKNNSENIKYKIVVLDEKKAKKQIGIIEHQGFTFVGSYKEYYIFSIDGQYGHIHPRLNEENIEFVRKWFNKQMIKRVGTTLLFLLPIVLNIIIGWDKLFQGMVEMSTILYLIWGFVFIFSIIAGTREYRAVIRSKKCFLENEEYLIVRNMKKLTIKSPFIILSCILIAVLLIKHIYFDLDKVSIDELHKEMPMVLLQDTEPQKSLEGEFNDDHQNIDEDNYAEIRHTLLAPNQYQAWQENAENGMVIFYYEVLVGALAEPLARELPTNDLAFIKKEELKKIDYEGLDAVYFSEEGYISVLSACKGKRVMFVLFDRELLVEDILSEMVEVL